MWYKTNEMMKDPESIARELAIAMQMVYHMKIEETDERNDKDMLIDAWLAKEARKPDLSYIR